MESDLIKFGRKISKLRQKRGLTQEKLAELIQYSPNHISKIESGRTYPSFELIINIAKALNVDTQELFNYNEPKSSNEIKKELYTVINNISSRDLELVYKITNTLYS